MLIFYRALVFLFSLGILFCAGCSSQSSVPILKSTTAPSDMQKARVPVAVAHSVRAKIRRVLDSGASPGPALNCPSSVDFCIIAGDEEDANVIVCCGGNSDTNSETYYTVGVPPNGVTYTFDPQTVATGSPLFPTTLEVVTATSSPVGQYDIYSYDVADNGTSNIVTLFTYLICDQSGSCPVPCATASPVAPTDTPLPTAEPCTPTNCVTFARKRKPASLNELRGLSGNMTNKIKNHRLDSESNSCVPPPPPPPVPSQSSYTASLLSQPNIQLTDSADEATYGGLEWDYSVDTSNLANPTFANFFTDAPHSNTFLFQVPETAATQLYQLDVYVVSTLTGQASSITTIPLTVLPPSGLSYDENAFGLYEVNSENNLIATGSPNLDGDTSSQQVTPDFRVSYASSTQAAQHKKRKPMTVVQGQYDPENPPASVLKDLDAFKAVGNAGCVFVVNYDNAMHDPTRGTQDSRANYQVFGYCSPNLGYAGAVELQGSDFNTGAKSQSSATAFACPINTNFVDGLYLCSVTNRSNVTPVSGHAEFFQVLILYFQAAQLVLPFLEPASQIDPGRVPINSKGVVYPKIDASSLNYFSGPSLAPGVVPFPNLAVTSKSPAQGIHYCPNLGYQAADGCVARGPAAGELRKALAEVQQPPNYGLLFGTYVPHHVQPVCWGGNNTAANGVFLLQDNLDPNEYHQQFTSWWSTSNFSLGNSVPPDPADLNCSDEP